MPRNNNRLLDIIKRSTSIHINQMKLYEALLGAGYTVHVRSVENDCIDEPGLKAMHPMVGFLVDCPDGLREVCYIDVHMYNGLDHPENQWGSFALMSGEESGEVSFMMHDLDNFMSRLNRMNGV